MIMEPGERPATGIYRSGLHSLHTGELYFSVQYTDPKLTASVVLGLLPNQNGGLCCSPARLVFWLTTLLGLVKSSRQARYRHQGP